MPARLLLTLLAHLFFLLGQLSLAQQYAGDVIPNSLPSVPGAEVAFFRINDPSGKNKNLTLINYYTHQLNGQRVVEKDVKRIVVIIHGLNRDPGTYAANMMSALAQLSTDSNVNRSSVAIMAPYFANGYDKDYGYPWTDGLKPGRGSTTNALVWKGSQWSAGANNQYPHTSSNTSSFAVLDQIIQYFSDASLFPKMTQIVIAGHSLGAQTVQRYAAIGQPGPTRVPVTYWVGNPNSYVWLSTGRPLSTAGCPSYDDYREGYTDFAAYPMTYGLSLVNSGRANILANYQSKQIAYGRGTQDLGDDSSSCAPDTTGSNRNERFFNFIKAFSPSCPDPAAASCDTVDFVNTGHDGGAMFASAAGQARLFTDNFYGDGKRAFDFGYPRQQLGDDPYPNPDLNTTAASLNNNTYAGNMTYQGCFSDQDPRSLANMTYASDSNTVEQCTSACASGGNTIAGLEFGTQCFCGTSLTYKADQVIDSSCSMPCPGNSSEICGGSNRLSIFSNGRPQVQSQPGTPETVGDAPFYYVSCYTEGASGRALGGKAISGIFMTLEYCANFCSAYKYFGTEYGSECYCGNSFGTGAARTDDNDCNKLCANDPTEFCGAGNRLTVYENPGWVDGIGTSTTTTNAGGSTTTTQGSLSTPSAVSCPASNGQVIAASNGKNFTIECGTDHQGGDLISLSVNSFYECMDTCAKNPQCVDVALSGSSCYLKSSVGAAVQNGVWGAKLLPQTSSASSIATSGSTTTTSSSSTAITGPAISVSTGIANFAYVACYAEVPGRALRATSTASAGMTNQLCASFCAGFQFFATEYASECYCGDELVEGSAALRDGRCRIGCAGDGTQVCGGPNGLSLYNVTAAAASVSSSSSGTGTSSTRSGFTSSGATLTTSTPVTSASSSSTSSSSIATSSPTSASSSLPGFSSSTTSQTSSSSSVLMTSTTSSSTTSSSSSSTTSAAATSLPPGFSSLGCYIDNNPSRALPKSNGTSSAQTPSQCALNCRDQGLKYSGTEYGSECWCGADLPTTSAPQTDCKTPCLGSKSLPCGGPNRLSLTVDTTWRQRFFATPSFQTWNLMGCYIDNTSGRLLKTAVSLSAFGGAGNATIGNCMAACQAKGFAYCGEEYYAECYGGNVRPDEGLLAPGKDALKAGCDFPCRGNASEACGGSNRILVYVNNGTAA